MVCCGSVFVCYICGIGQWPIAMEDLLEYRFEATAPCTFKDGKDRIVDGRAA